MSRESLYINLEELRKKMLLYRDLHVKNENPEFVIERISQDINEFECALGTIEHMTFVYGGLPLEDNQIDLEDE